MDGWTAGGECGGWVHTPRVVVVGVHGGMGVARLHLAGPEGTYQFPAALDPLGARWTPVDPRIDALRKPAEGRQVRLARP